MTSGNDEDNDVYETPVGITHSKPPKCVKDFEFNRTIVVVVNSKFYGFFYTI